MSSQFCLLSMIPNKSICHNNLVGGLGFEVVEESHFCSDPFLLHLKETTADFHKSR